LYFPIHLPGHIVSKEEAILELEAQLAASRREIERLGAVPQDERDAAAALIAAVTPVKLPDFWVRIRYCGSGSVSQPSDGPPYPPQA
jgi:hypothetical protein